MKRDHQTEELWVQVERPAHIYVPCYGSFPTDPSFTRREAERQLRAAGCTGYVEFLSTAIWVDGSVTRRDTYRSSRPTHGQATNPAKGRAVDDARNPQGLAQTTTPSGAGPTTGARNADHDTQPGPAASGNPAGPPTPGT